MGKMKEIWKKHRKRGKPVVLALLTCLVLTLVVSGVTWLNDYFEVQAKKGLSKHEKLEAYCYDTLDKFKEKMEGQYSGDGLKGKYGLKINKKGSYIQCDGYSCEHCASKRGLNGRRLTVKDDLKERCDPSDPDSPLRYWFWIKARNYAGGSAANMYECEDGWTQEERDAAEEESSTADSVASVFSALSSLGSGDWEKALSLADSTLTSLKAPEAEAACGYTRWHTEYFYTSTEPLEGPNYNAKADPNTVKCPMANVKQGGIFQDLGTEFSDGRKLCVYVVDIQPFYKEITKDKNWGKFNGYVYLHTVAGVSDSDHSKHRSDITKSNEWKKYGSDMKSFMWELEQSYNQWLYFYGDDDEHEKTVNVTVYAVKSKGDKPTKKEMKHNGANMLGKDKTFKEIPIFTGIELSGLKTFKENGVTYKLKGVRLQDSKDGKKWKKRQFFSVLDKDLFLKKGASTSTGKYTKSTSKSEEKDMLTGVNNTVYYWNTLKVAGETSGGKARAAGGTTKFTKTGLREAKEHTWHGQQVHAVSYSPFKGAKKLSKLQNAMLKDAVYKAATRDVRLCLVYQEVPKNKINIYLWEYDTAEMVFDFPVYADGTYHEADETWVQKGVSKTAFYPAYWADEAQHSFTGRVDALNVEGVDGSAGIESRSDLGYCEFEENADRRNHRAENVLLNYVTGVLTDLRITDVADYPYLQYVFRQGDEGSVYQYRKTGYTIDTGATNFQGILNVFNQLGVDWTPQTFPVVNGNVVGYKNYGVFKPGYKVRFNLTTIATMNHLDDYVQIEPSFYWLPKDTSGTAQTPQPVKVYYDENIGGETKRLVEVGSDLDQTNVHQLCVGDKEHDVDVADLVTTSEYLGTELKELYQGITDAWTYGDVKVPGTMHVCEGLKNEKLLEHAYGTDQTWEIPESREEDADKCLQTWYGEYFLPNTIHVRAEGTDDQFKEDLTGGIDYTEDYWRNDGYLLVKFDIYTVQGGQKHLMYDATGFDPTYCNMWKTENQIAEKTDSDGQKFNWASGDFLLYDLSSSMSDDYKSGGTH